MARPSRIVLILGFAVLAPAASGAAASAAGISLASGARVVSAAGRIGPLRVDRSRAGAIRRYAGTPMFAGSGRPGSGMGLRSFKALGYRCAPRRADGRGINPGGVRKTHVWCRTVFFLNARTGRLAGFWTDSPIFRTAKAIRPEMRQATADRFAHAHAYVRALTGISVDTRTASLFIENTGCKLKTPGGNPATTPCVGGYVRSLIVEGHHPVGLLEDGFPSWER